MFADLEKYLLYKNVKWKRIYRTGYTIWSQLGIKYTSSYVWMNTKVWKKKDQNSNHGSIQFLMFGVIFIAFLLSSCSDF